MDDVRPNHAAVDRRSLLVAGAWAAPAVAVAVAMPLAAASITNAGDPVVETTTGLQVFNTMDPSGVPIFPGRSLTYPTGFTIANGPGAVSAPGAIVTVSVSRPDVPLQVGRARGFGIYSMNGTLSSVEERSTVYQTDQFQGQYGFPLTTFTRIMDITIPSNGSLAFSFVLGLAGVSTNVFFSQTVNFAMTISVDLDGVVKTATTSISVPPGPPFL